MGCSRCCLHWWAPEKKQQGRTRDVTVTCCRQGPTCERGRQGEGQSSPQACVRSAVTLQLTLLGQADTRPAADMRLYFAAGRGRGGRGRGRRGVPKGQPSPQELADAALPPRSSRSRSKNPARPPSAASEPPEGMELRRRTGLQQFVKVRSLLLDCCSRQRMSCVMTAASSAHRATQTLAQLLSWRIACSSLRLTAVLAELSRPARMCSCSRRWTAPSCLSRL